MDFLGEIMTASLESEEETYEETRGRPRLLKSYMMEVNCGKPFTFATTFIKSMKTETKLPEVSILDLEYSDSRARFYVDASDKRFWILHTNELAETANRLFRRLVFSPDASFDRAWLPIEMMRRIAKLPGSLFRGFGLKYEDLFGLTSGEERSVEELRMRVSGSSSMDALEALQDKEKLRKALSYSMVRIRRGALQNFVTGELGYDSRFIARAGSSIDNYVGLIEITRKIYREMVEAIERNSLGVKEVENRTLVEGSAFDFTLEREIEELESFTTILTSADPPFRLWGLKNKIAEDFYQIAGVDLHTGDPIDLEISPSSIRLYLHHGSCGNTVLRLYANLQHYFDSEIKLNDDSLPEG
jgi:hypothetical protein